MGHSFEYCVMEQQCIINTNLSIEQIYEKNNFTISHPCAILCM